MAGTQERINQISVGREKQIGVPPGWPRLAASTLATRS
jgi:hypothetical protein